MYTPDIRILRLDTGRESDLSSFILSVFDEFVGVDYNAEGNRTFREYIEPDAIAERRRNGNLFCIAEVSSRTIGVIEIRSCDHISLLFVDKEFHRQGIARNLLEYAIADCRKRGSGFSSLSVNASPYSVAIYARLGFTATGPLTETDGIKYIPMTRD